MENKLEIRAFTGQTLENMLISIQDLDMEQLTRLGAAGREYVLDHFSKQICLPQVIKVLKMAAGNGE